MSNYPEGVTGSEYEIAGPQGEHETTALVQCTGCGWEDDLTFDVSYYDGEEFGYWSCPTCGKENGYSHYPEFDWSGS